MLNIDEYKSEAFKTENLLPDAYTVEVFPVVCVTGSGDVSFAYNVIIANSEGEILKDLSVYDFNVEIPTELKKHMLTVYERFNGVS